jgi:hypothetical protein
MNYYMRLPFPAMVFLRTAPTEQVLQRIRARRTIWFFTSYAVKKNDSIFPAARFTPALELSGVGRLERVDLPPPATDPSGLGN